MALVDDEEMAELNQRYRGRPGATDVLSFSYVDEPHTGGVLGEIYVSPDEAARQSQRALALQPGMAEAHRNNAILRLMQGDFAAGWEEFEWRWQCSRSGRSTGRRPAGPR